MKKLLKLFIYILSIMSMFAITFSFVSSKKVILANNNDVEFENFDFILEKTRERGKIKVKIIFSWDTNEEIIIEEISTKISDQVQSTYDKPVGVKTETGYHYNLEYIVQNWQIGTMEVEIKYKSFNQLGTNEVLTETFYIPGGKWMTNEVSWGQSIAVGSIVTIAVMIVTYILIENSKKGYMDSEQEE